MGLLVIKFVDRVCVVPEYPEVGRRGLHGRQLVHYFVGIRDALGVGELRNTPDAFHRRIGAGYVVYLIHVRAVCVHFDRHHLYAHRPADGEVSVVSRGRTDEFYPALAGPWFVSSGHSEEHCPHHRVVHHVQR